MTAQYSERLKALRLKEFGDWGGMRKIAKKISVDESLYGKYENDSVQMPYEKLIELHKLTGVNLNWLLAGSGPPYEQDYYERPQIERIPFLNVCAAAGMPKRGGRPRAVEQVSDFGNAKKTPGAKLVAIVCDGDSMMPIIKPGTILIGDPEHPLSFGQIVIYLQKGDKEPHCKIFDRDFEDGREWYVLKSLKQGEMNERVRADQIEWMYPVVEHY